MNGLHVAYVIITFLLAVYLTLTSKTNHKFITFIIVYWVFAGSVLNTEYFIIDISALPFDLQPNRLILIFFSIYLFTTWAIEHKNKRTTTENPKFEKILYLYIFFSIIIYMIHTIDILTLEDSIVNVTHIFTFLVIYLVLRSRADQEMIKVFAKSLLIVCIVSSLIGIYQFSVDPLFFRFGSQRVAFAGFFRGNGIYSSDHIQGYFLTSGIVLALFVFRRKLVKFALISLFLLGIILCFHRMSYIITIMLFSLYFIGLKGKRIWLIVAGNVVFAILLFRLFPMLGPNIGEIESSAVFQERLLVDTMADRAKFARIVLDNISQSWLIGFGGTKSEVYYRGMTRAGLDEEWAAGQRGGIHNLYLHVMFFEGIPAAILFSLFMISAVCYFWKSKKLKHMFYFIPLFEVMKYIVSNLTNTNFMSADIGLLLAIYLGIGVAVCQKNIDADELIVNATKNEYKRHRF
jgi:hypothetical protein